MMIKSKILNVIFLSAFWHMITFGQVSYTEYNNLLKAHVSSSGQVDYKGLKLKTKAVDNIIVQWSKQKLDKLNKDEQLAFYINVYNLSTINLILKNYPIKSIKDIQKGKPWDLMFVNIENKNYTLNQIENSIIRPIYKDPRIHFALNCAALSCPPLHNEAFTGANLNQKLEALTISFLNNKNFNSVNNNRMQISKIFDWYKEDFGSVLNFLSKYITVPNPKLPINYIEYNWALNGK